MQAARSVLHLAVLLALVAASAASRGLTQIGPFALPPALAAALPFASPQSQGDLLWAVRGDLGFA